MQPPTHFADIDDSHLPVALRRRARAVARRVDVVAEEARGAPPLRTSSIAVRRDDKSVFDSYASYCEVELGRRLSQWDTFTLLLSEAMGNRRGRFARWSRWHAGGGVTQGATSRTAGPRSSP